MGLGLWLLNIHYFYSCLLNVVKLAYWEIYLSDTTRILCNFAAKLYSLLTFCI